MYRIISYIYIYKYRGFLKLMWFLVSTFKPDDVVIQFIFTLTWVLSMYKKKILSYTSK